MNMIKIAVCDDEPLTRSYLISLIRKQGMETEIAEYDTADALLRRWTVYDLLFLDIELNALSGRQSAEEKPGLSGMELARQIRAAHGPWPLIIFVTGYESYVYDAFDVEAFQYLLKPIDEQRFSEVFRRAFSRIRADTGQPCRKLVIQSAKTSKILPLDNIRYIESQGHKIVIHLRDDALEYYAKLGDLEQQLQGQFCRIHKGILVNLSYVEEYSRTAVVLTGGEKLNLSKYKYANFVKTHLRYMRTRGIISDVPSKY